MHKTLLIYTYIFTHIHTHTHTHTHTQRHHIFYLLHYFQLYGLTITYIVFANAYILLSLLLLLVLYLIHKFRQTAKLGN